MFTDIRLIEELSLNAWPCLRQLSHDGWLLRFAAGYTGRSNSVQPRDDGVLDVHDKIRFCEAAYGAAGLPCLFKLTAGARPADLDATLEQAGYRAFNHTSVQACELPALSLSSPEHVVACDRLDDAWMAAFAAFRSLPDRHVATLRAMLAKLRLPTQYVTVMQDGDIVACGLGVLEHPWVGLFDIGTREDRRRRGNATAVVTSLLAWARGEGAEKSYLQVAADNTPAVNLYAKLGFREMYRYWYRSKPA